MLQRASVSLLAVMAALILTTNGTAAPPEPPGPFLMSGQVSAVAADSISVTQRDQTVKIPIDGTTVIRVDMQVVAVGDLKVGLAVGVWGTTGKPAVEVRAYTAKPPASNPAQPNPTPPNPPGPFQISGRISDVAADSISVTQRDQTVKIPIGAATVIRVDMQVVAVGDLKVGMGVGVWGTNGKPAVEIRAYTPKPPK